MIDKGIVPHVAAVVPQEEAVAVPFIAQNKVAVLSVAHVALPVLSGGQSLRKRQQGLLSYHPAPLPSPQLQPHTFLLLFTTLLLVYL